MAAVGTTWVLLSGSQGLENGHSQVKPQGQNSETPFQASSLNCRAEVNFSKRSPKKY